MWRAEYTHNTQHLMLEGTSEIDMIIIDSLKWKNKNDINKNENNNTG